MKPYNISAIFSSRNLTIKYKNLPFLTDFTKAYFLSNPKLLYIFFLPSLHFRSSKSEMDNETVSLAETAVASEEEEDSDDVRELNYLCRYFIYFIFNIFEN